MLSLLAEHEATIAAASAGGVLAVAKAIEFVSSRVRARNGNGGCRKIPERLAVIETRQDGFEASLRRFEKSQLRMETKLDDVLKER